MFEEEEEKACIINFSADDLDSNQAAMYTYHQKGQRDRRDVT